MNASKRREAEKLLYDVMDQVDKTGANTEYYKNMFNNMTDDQFLTFMSRRLPIRFHHELFKIEPKMHEIFAAFKALGKPLLEKVKQPYLYINKDGVPVETYECLVVYIHLKRMKQMIAKKNSTAIDIDNRDMKTGLLLGDDKGGKESDREFESLVIMGLDYTVDEFSRIRADAMKSKAEAYSIINSKGILHDSDIVIEKEDSLSNNMLNVYLIGANIHTNLIDEDYMTPLTIKNKKSTMISR